jgi:hypothetical protein
VNLKFLSHCGKLAQELQIQNRTSIMSLLALASEVRIEGAAMRGQSRHFERNGRRLMDTPDDGQ